MAKVKKLNRKGNRGKSSRSKTRRRSEGKGRVDDIPLASGYRGVSREYFA